MKLSYALVILFSVFGLLACKSVPTYTVTPEIEEWQEGKNRYATQDGFTTGKVKLEKGVHSISQVIMPNNAPSIVSDYASLFTGLGARRPKELIPHTGLDITAITGYPVIASADGEVILSHKAKSAGEVVVIEHSATSTHKLLTAYIHLNQRAVKAGEVVKRGQIIGTVGKTGKASGKHDHLHWGVDLLPLDKPDKHFWKHHVNPHSYWYGGAGKVTCYNKGATYPDNSKFTYPVPCL